MTTETVSDPVCGMPVDPTKTQHKTEYLGKTYYFCSPGCKQSFDDNPERYVLKQEAEAHTKGVARAGHAAMEHGGAAAGGERPPQFFPRDIAELPDALNTVVIEPDHGEIVELRAAAIRKRIGDDAVKMLGYNASVPGTTVRVRQGTELSIQFRNELELKTTVHWHGLRHDNLFDGVPSSHRGLQKPVQPGESFTYELRFPDAGIFWYHPHMREDYAQELGLYGSIIVTPEDASYWPPANREVSLIIDDILIEDGEVAPFRRAGSDRTAMGRFGNVMLVNGETDFKLEANAGEVIRLYLTNTANTRVFNVAIPGARLKLVGGDNGRVEHETFVDEVMLGPSERAVVDARFERPGHVAIEHRTPEKAYLIGAVDVSAEPVGQSYAAEFDTLRTNAELAAERDAITSDLERAPDKILALVGVMPGMGHGGEHGNGDAPAIEWEDTMEAMNRMSTPANMVWKLVDQETGAENHAISWEFRLGERVKIRIVNDPASDHPMQHPFHIHGERFLVLSRDGIVNPNLVWKDTVLISAGETVDLLMEASNPGIWMAHCHIAEHLEGGMMLTFTVHG